eukprot:8589122-Karenia_brevis.AAC.1
MVTKPHKTNTAENSSQLKESSWYFGNLNAGSVPIRCGSLGKLQCASNDGANCQWGMYGSSYSAYQIMSGVSASQPFEISCPGWTAKDGSDACSRLSCYEA